MGNKKLGIRNEDLGIGLNDLMELELSFKQMMQ